MITYDPLWQTLEEKGISQYDLLTKYGISRGMLDNLKHNRSITINTLDDLCTMLDCDITDILYLQQKERPGRMTYLLGISYLFWSLLFQF